MSPEEGADPRIAPVAPAELGEVAAVLSAAFWSDPVWTAVGPRLRAQRRLSNRVSFWGIVRGSHRQGARMRLARLDGEPVGATIAFEPGRWPLPDSAAAWELPWALVAGPASVLRGLRVEKAMREAHVAHPHQYLWYIGVVPGLQGSGVGRALMAELHADAEAVGVPTYLETGTRPNIGFYQSLGYALEGEIEVPRGGPQLWRMQRPAPGAG